MSSNKIFIIDTFNKVSFNDNCKPLVICDIDHTFMRCRYDIEYFQKIANTGYNRSCYTNAFDIMTNAYNNGIVRQTDPIGFNNMLENIKRLDGKFIFLTARSNYYHKKTLLDLKFSGLTNPEDFEIHYTNNEMSKGEYIKKHIILDGYTHISFIDDYPSFIASVQQYFPNIICYLFRYS